MKLSKVEASAFCTSNQGHMLFVFIYNVFYQRTQSICTRVYFNPHYSKEEVVLPYIKKDLVLKGKSTYFILTPSQRTG